MIKLKNNHLYDDRASQIVSWGHWFTLFNILFVIVIGSQYLMIADWPATLLGRIYAIMSVIGHFSFLAFIVYLIFLFPLSFFVHSIKFQRTVAVIVATVAIVLLLLDIEIFSRFRMHLNFSLWQILMSSDDNIFNAQWQKIFIFIPAVLLVQIIFAIWSWRKLRSLTKRRRYCKPVVIVLVLCFLSSHFIHIWADAHFYRPITMQRSSLPVSYPMTAKHFLEKYGFLQPTSYQQQIEKEGDPFAMAIEYPLGRIQYAPINRPMNILMIIVDDWYIDEKQSATPKLDALAQHHLQFLNHYASSNNHYLNEFSLFYGLDPNYYNSILATHKSSLLIDIATKQHYSLGLFATDGFAHSLYRYALLSNFSIPDAAEQSIDQVTENWSNWFDDKIALDVPAHWLSIIKYAHNQDIDENNRLALSDRMKSVDNAIDRVLTKLQQAHQLDNTVVVITANNKLPQQHSSDKLRYSRDALRMPLIVVWPDKNAEQFTKNTSHVSIMQTLMQNALNVTSPAENYSQGENLFMNHQPKWLIAGSEKEIAALYSDHTIVVDSFGHYQIFDANNQLQEDRQLGLSTFLQLITENRRFMVVN